mgnify:CR=1 FL=1
MRAWKGFAVNVSLVNPRMSLFLEKIQRTKIGDGENANLVPTGKSGMIELFTGLLCSVITDGNVFVAGNRRIHFLP